MKCPVCNSIDLKMTDRQGVEIDYCPECRGIWLDRGELDKILERSYGQATPISPPVRQYPERDHHQQQSYAPRHHDDDEHLSGGRHGRKSWLSELFD
jgi:uncharacterized protein